MKDYERTATIKVGKYKISYLTFETEKGNNFLLETDIVGNYTHFNVEEAGELVNFLNEKLKGFDK